MRRRDDITLGVLLKRALERENWVRSYSLVYLNNLEYEIIGGISRLADNFLKSWIYILLNIFYKADVEVCRNFYTFHIINSYSFH